MKHEILLGLTTTPKSDWRGKVEEMKKFGIKKIALFPTCLEYESRQKLYEVLETIEGLEMPHVHLRNDMDSAEIEYFIKKYNTKVFNTHPQKFCPTLNDWSKYSSKIFIENTGSIPTIHEIEENGGICIDFSHLESFLKSNDDAKDYAKFVEYMTKYKIGCCHVSAIMNEPWLDTNDPGTPNRKAYDSHTLSNLFEVDYLVQYIQYLPEYISLELENSFAEQLEVKKYLEQKLGI